MIINKDWVSGFVDGEGTFYVGINYNSTMTNKIQILPEFRIVQHEKDIKLLYALKDFFKAGVVRVNHDNRYELRVRRLQHLSSIIIPHFQKHPLITQKQFDFIKFTKIVELMIKQKHLNKEEIIKIIDISCKMNRQNKEKALKIKEMLLRQDKVHT